MKLPAVEYEAPATVAEVVGLLAEHQDEASVLAGGQSLIPLLAAALPLIGHEAIRSRGTIGGSLAHAGPAAELPAVTLGF